MEDKSCFYKIIIFKDTKELRLPEAFVRSHRRSLLDHATIRAPGGKEHVIELSKHDGDLWFSKGWTDFSKQYSLKPWNFLVFRYHGHSMFHVLIFDKSCSEIEYPNVEIRSSDEEVDGSRLGKSKALKMAEELVLSFSNPNFIVSMGSSYLTGKDVRMWVPFHHTRQHLVGVRVLRLKLEGEPSTGKSWIVNVAKTSGSVRLSVGWKGFVKDNKLKVGDVCVFELVNPNDHTYLVHILDDSD